MRSLASLATLFLIHCQCLAYGQVQPTPENPDASFQATAQTWAVTAGVPVTIRPTEQSPTYSQETIVPVPEVKKSFCEGR